MQIPAVCDDHQTLRLRTWIIDEQPGRSGDRDAVIWRALKQQLT